jgi:hypothetical protein
VTANGATARITVRTGATTQRLLAEWASGAWQSGNRRFAPGVVTDVQPVTVTAVTADQPGDALCRAGSRDLVKAWVHLDADGGVLAVWTTAVDAYGWHTEGMDRIVEVALVPADEVWT